MNRRVRIKAGPYRGLVGVVTETLPDGNLVVGYPRGTKTLDGVLVSSSTLSPQSVEDGPKDRLLRPLHRCDKAGCGRYATTVEIGSEHFPSALCEDHAERPDQYGTFDLPFRVGEGGQ